MLTKKTLLTSALSLSLLTSYSAHAETFSFVEKPANNIDTLVVFQAGENASSALTKLDKQ